MEQKTKNLIYFCVGVILVGGIYLLFFNKAEYADVYTPKPLQGNVNATVKIVEFSDLQCPACKAAHPTVKRIMEEYGDRVSLEYKHFPLTNLHKFAFDTAVASECANDQGKFWEFADTAFANQDALQKKNLRKYAVDLGLDSKKFNACIDSGTKEKYVKAEMNEGFGKQVGGTPTFFINGKTLESWKYEMFKAALDETLNQTK